MATLKHRRRGASNDNRSFGEEDYQDLQNSIGNKGNVHETQERKNTIDSRRGRLITTICAHLKSTPQSIWQNQVKILVVYSSLWELAQLIHKAIPSLFLSLPLPGTTAGGKKTVKRQNAKENLKTHNLFSLTGKHSTPGTDRAWNKKNSTQKPCQHQHIPTSATASKYSLIETQTWRQPRQTSRWTRKSDLKLLPHHTMEKRTHAKILLSHSPSAEIEQILPTMLEKMYPCPLL